MICDLYYPHSAGPTLDEQQNPRLWKIYQQIKKFTEFYYVNEKHQKNNNESLNVNGN